MRIKRIEIIGFKSFCDRTVINFDHQIVGVVGPNGCGKSNVVDAIRWCMGEQSAKHLRGQAMGDVIFAGSDSRGPAGMAEVSLTFEQVGFSQETLNLALHDEAELQVAEPEAEADVVAEADAVAAAASAVATADAGADSASRDVAEFLADKNSAIDFSAYTEVTITRRLFRDGTSQYFLNKSPCRLRDITDFFLGTGVGTKAYSIIEQGRVGQIVSARPGDRRTVIEEAAGITKFKTKKKAAERKLEQTKQNLLRVSDIVSELDRRLGTLRRQAQKAERYRKYKSELRDIEMWAASHKLLELAVEDRLTRRTLAERQDALIGARAEFETRDARVVAERAELAVEERRLAALQEQIFELENRVRLSESKVEYQRREADELEARAASAASEIGGLEARLEETRIERAAKAAELDAITLELGASDSALAARDAGFGEARRTLAEAQRQLDEARGQIATARADLVRASGQREALGRRREDGARRLATVMEETGQGNARSQELDREVHRLVAQLAALRQTKLDLGSKTEELQERQRYLTDQLETSEAEVETLRTELHRRKSRLVSLREIHERYEGFARGTRAVMQQGEGRGIRGLVADVIQAPATLEVAVEAALGDRLGGVLVDSHDASARAIRYLKDASAGRSAFVPAGGPAGIAIEDRTGWPGEQTGVVGSLVDLVRMEDGYDHVGPSLFGDALVVEDLDRALALRGEGLRQTMVTLDGDVVDARGVVAGGSRDAQGSGVLGQKREIRELEEICGGLEHDLADATARYVAGKSELQQVTRALEGLRKENHDGELQVLGKDKDLSVARAELERVRERLTRLNAEQLDLDERMRAMAAEEAELDALARSATERSERFEAEQLGLIGGVTDAQERVEQAGAELTEAKVRRAQIGEQRASLDAACLRLDAAAGELEARLARLGASITDDGARARALRVEAGEIAGGLDTLRQDRRARAEELSEGRVVYERRSGEVQVEEGVARKKRLESEQLGGEVTSLEVKLERLAGSRQHLVEGIAERYRVDLARQIGDYHMRPEVGPREEERLSELRGLIERMGADINLTAIEEFQELSKRFEFLSTQKGDLENAVAQLERAIAKINKTSRTLFQETFDAVNAKFKEVFPRLFRGGNAQLSLSGGDGDVLEAGVEIFAQPPGKKNVTVDQLSGGEKALTAVALLFAIFLIKPSPFCLLDEVDAPLDEANVDRYNLAIREMTDRSQFIVISHNKRTMETCDRLYGVTMQEPGVSKLVSVNLAKLAEAA